MTLEHHFVIQSLLLFRTIFSQICDTSTTPFLHRSKQCQGSTISSIVGCGGLASCADSEIINTTLQLTCYGAASCTGISTGNNAIINGFHECSRFMSILH